MHLLNSISRYLAANLGTFVCFHLYMLWRAVASAVKR